MKLFKYDIKTETLLKKGVTPINDDFFVGMICGPQGTGKNWWGVMLVDMFKDKTIITNIQSLNIPDRKIIKFVKIEEIYKFDDSGCIFLIDECSKKWPKESKQDRAFYSWLMQSRKHTRYVLLIFQEYIQVPTWLRGVANKVYTTRKSRFNLCITSLGFPVLNEESKEWETENIKYFVYKRINKYSNYYDTFERIESL